MARWYDGLNRLEGRYDGLMGLEGRYDGLNGVQVLESVSLGNVPSKDVCKQIWDLSFSGCLNLQPKPKRRSFLI